MRIVVFGLSVSSSWGNGHATLWRGLIAALGRRGAEVTFFERDRPWYRDSRDVDAPEGGRLVVYEDVAAETPRMREALRDADAAIVTSFCPDGVAAERLVREAGVTSIFYDLDTPVTLQKIAAGETLDWIGPDGLASYDLVLSYTGGGALDALRDRLGARRTAPLHGHVDPRVHRPAAPRPEFAGDLSHLGTYAADRQPMLDRLFLEPARRAPERRFVIGGAQYPQDFPWTANVAFVRHLPPDQHPAFYASSRFTLNVTRAAMAASGWCPSGRLFEAAACGAAIVSDDWAGLDAFFVPGEEILVASSAEDVLAALDLPEPERIRIGAAARERVLAEHTSERRAEELLGWIEAASRPGSTVRRVEEV